MSTTIHVNPALLQELVNLLIPYMSTEQERQAKLHLALPNGAYRQINFHGAADVFTANLVNRLLHYGEVAPGKQAIIAVLDVIHAQVGADKQQEIDQLRQKLQAHFGDVQAGVMRCPHCGSANRATAKFCGSCGQPFPVTLSVTPAPGPTPSLEFWRGSTARWLMVAAGIAMMVAVVWIGAHTATPIAPTGAPPTDPSPADAGQTTAQNPQPTPPNGAQGADLAPLVGIWRISRQDNMGSSLENWEITEAGNQITITEFHQAVAGVPLPGDYRKQLRLTDFVFDGQRLAFTATGSVEGVTESFDLTLLGTDRMEGNYTSTDTFLSDTGIIQGSTGVLRSEGRAILVRQ